MRSRLLKKRYSLLAIWLTLCLWIGWTTLHPTLPTSVHLYSNQTRDDLRLLFRRAMESATDSIHLMIYNLSDPTLLHTLEKQARRGIEVVVLTGADEANRLRSKLPSVEIIAREIKGRMHQKVLVIDSHQVWLGSANWTGTSLRVHGNLVVGLESPQLAQELITSTVSRLPKHPPLAPIQLYKVAQQKIEYWQLPTQGEEALSRLLELITGAQHELRIAMFTWTHPVLTQAIIEAHQSGVRVEAMIDGQAGRGSSRKVVAALKAAGVPVRLNLGPELLHHKFLWIDREQLVVGSTNWTQAAFSENDDAFLVIAPLSKKQKAKLQSLWRVLYCESEQASNNQ